MKNKLTVSLLALSVAGGVQAQELMMPIGEDARFSWASLEPFNSADLSGETINVTGAWTGDEKETVEKVIDYFEQATGADVAYSGSESFEQDIVIAAQAGSAPNVAIFPQPGLAADMARKGFLTPLGSERSAVVLDSFSAGQSWVDLGTYGNADGEKDFFGVFYRADVKSLVWYSPENFEEAGYEVPTTLEDLKALTETMAADGQTPWCIGLGSGAATGWPATDWVEDMMLRTQAPEVYDQWVANELPFTDPAVVGAIEEYGFFAKNDAFVAGGSSAVVNTDFRDSPTGLFDLPAKCMMHHQASFIPAFFPEGTVVGEDVTFFYMPAYESKDLGKPVLGAGTIATITNDSKGAQAFIDFLLTPLAHELWMTQGGFVSAHKGANIDTYSDETFRKLGKILLDASTFRFDGSDLMPGEIGADAFWKGMVAYTGGEDVGTVTKDIQERWDSIKAN